MKLNNITVAVGALGASIHIGSKASRFNGSSQFVKLIQALCSNPNISNVVIMGVLGRGSEDPKDWKEIDPKGKIIYPLPMVHKIAQHVWGANAEFPSYRTPYPDGSREMLPYHQERPFQDLYAKYCAEKVPPIDFGLFFMTQGATGTNIAGVIKCKTSTRSDEYRIQLPGARKCSAPFMNAINLLKFPWYMLSTDDRVVTSMPRHDLTNFPLAVLGQWNTKHTWSVINSYDTADTYVDKVLDIKYSGVEKLNLIQEQPIDPSTERPTLFALVANQTTSSNDLSCHRFQELKKWILDHPWSKDFEIYGEFDNAYITGYEPADSSKEEHQRLIAYNKRKDISHAEIKYPQFKGRVQSHEIDAIFAQTKYTLCIPVIKGYLTSKYGEMLLQGALPFIPPFYDEQFNAIPQDCFLRVTSPTDMWNKIQYLEARPGAREQLVKHFQKLWVEPCLDGSFISAAINKFLEESDVPCRI